jgi:hypothetical protein
MQSTLNPKPSDDPHDVVVVAPDVVRVAPANDEISSLLQQAARYSAAAPTRANPDLPAGATIPAVDTTFRPAAVGDVPAMGNHASMARRAMRGVVALLVAACIGLFGVVWKSYGEVASRQIAKWTTQLVLTTSLPPETPAPAAQPDPPVVQADAAAAASTQSTDPAQSATETVAPAVAASAESAQLVQSMSRDLASLGQQVEQLKASIAELKAGRQQVSREVAKASEQNVRPRTAVPAPRPAAARARRPMPSYLPTQAAAAPALAPAVAPYYPPRQPDYVPRQAEPQPQFTSEPPADPELSSVPRPPMPMRGAD